MGKNLVIENICFYFSDIDECGSVNDCDMRPGVGVCTNTPGSYTCGCAAGYELAPNKKTCNGEGIRFRYWSHIKGGVYKKRFTSWDLQLLVFHKTLNKKIKQINQ